MGGSDRPLVLCYHAISDTWEHFLAVPPRNLEWQLQQLLAHGYRPATAREVSVGRGRLLHVTFDDAFTSVRGALPVLARQGVRATVFVCSGFAGDGMPLRVPELAAEADTHPDELATMSWDELRDLAERGLEVGSHTESHAHLRSLSDAELARELTESRERIEAELRQSCPFFAYPYGEQDERVRHAARAAGYDAAFGLQPKDSTWSDPYRLPRVGIWRGEGKRTFAFKTSPLGQSAPVMLLRRARDRVAT